MNDRDVYGPIDTLIIEFPGSADGTRTAAALRDLVDSGAVLLYDLMVVRKGSDGTCVEVDLGTRPGDLGTFAGARSGLLGEDDLAEIGEVLEPDTVAVALVYENAWAVPFVAAARAEGGEVVASGRLTAQEIMDAIDAIESAV